MWSGGSSRNLLRLIKRWVSDGILSADCRYRSVCVGSYTLRWKQQGPAVNVLSTSALRSTISPVHCALKCWLFPLWYQNSLREKKLLKCGCHQLRGLDLKPVGHFHRFQEKVELFLISILWVSLTTLLLISSNVMDMGMPGVLTLYGYNE